MPEKERSVGGLWKRQDKNGTTYLSGEIEIGGEKHKIVVFKNARKQEGESTPDYRIFPQIRRQDDDSAPF